MLKTNLFIFEQTYLKSIQYQHFYKNIIKIFNSNNIACIFDNTNIINQQAHPQVKYEQKIISYINNCQYLTVLKYENILKFIPKNWKYYNKLLQNNNKKDIIIFKTNFSNPKYLFHLFAKLGYANYPYKKQDQDFFKKDFLKNIGNCDGACLFFNNYDILFLNTQSYNKITISHQLTHYFQDILHINILNKIPKYNKKLLLYLQLDQDYFKYIFSEKQFWTHIYVDLFQGLKKVFFKYYFISNKFLKQDFLSFIDILDKEIKNDALHIMYSEIAIQYIKENKNANPLLLASIYILNENQLYKKVINQLKITI